MELPKDPLDTLVNYAFALLSRAHRYQWGGDDPILGFDCSGFVLELLKASGEIHSSSPKLSAQMIFNFYKHLPPGPARKGALVFYGKDTSHVTHIAFCIDSEFIIEAGGGDSSTLNDQRAIEQNAFIKMRPAKHRKDFLCILMPKYAVIQGLIP